MFRPRRLRRTAALRSLVRQTRVSPDSLIYPLFVQEGRDIKEEISAMPGQYHYSPDRLGEAVAEAWDAGVRAVLLFGLPDHKDEVGSEAYSADGVVQQAIRALRDHFPELVIIADLCLCEYTSHGHCGLICQQGHRWTVDNDATLEILAKTALSQLAAGADVVAPSDMMDGRVAAIRQAMDEGGFQDRALFSYAVKYASAFYGPFREAAGSAPAFGDRRGYQMDYHNFRESLMEAQLDQDEGADAIIVKPGLPYLDVLSAVAAQSRRPLASYWVSGEYSMIKAAAAKGWIDEAAVVCESAVAFYRAGANMLITYHAKELARWMKEGRLG